MNIYDFANSSLYSGAGNVAAGANRFANVGTIANGMGAYTNPYEDQVVGNVQNDLLRQAQMLYGNNRAAASAAGGFGGSRHGVIDALTNEALLRTMADTSSNLRLQGFNTAAGLAGQDINNSMAAGSGLLSAGGQQGALGSVGFDMGQQISADQAQQGTMLQQLQQGILNLANGAFANFANQPVALLDMRSAAAMGSPLNQATTATSSYTPGLFDYLSLGLGAGAANKKAGKK